MYALLLLTLAAPAPFAKPAPPPPAVKHGSYIMTWHGVTAPTWLHADGFYACQWHGRWWHGHWRQENGQIIVEEWPMEEPHRRSTWTIKLASPMSGQFPGGSPWKLAPQFFGGDA
jgi:hypothetical protein